MQKISVCCFWFAVWHVGDGSQRWLDAPKDFAKRGMYFTKKNDAIFMIVFSKDGGEVVIPGLKKVEKVSMLGTTKKVEWDFPDNRLVVKLPSFTIGTAPVEFAPVFKIATGKPPQ